MASNFWSACTGITRTQIENTPGGKLFFGNSVEGTEKETEQGNKVSDGAKNENSSIFK
ncbi:MAG: hypothetical protein LUG16_05035 [Candidatus Gastranaerophilales bacterium]|nr:hypothetical protein [Candidatus Gastranaerophilales bacterium]